MKQILEDSAQRSRFIISDPALCYLDGNSLGRLPKAAADRIEQVVRQGWGEQLIRGWNTDWIHLPSRVNTKLARLLHCDAAEITIADSTSINLYKLATAALRHQSQRSVVLTDASNFPSDLYILESAIEASANSQKLRTVGTADQVTIETQEIIEHIDDSTALVCLSHVAFRSGQLHDLEGITDAAHRKGALVLWDLSHSVGAVPINLTESNVDMAVGCTYKFLCGGPGSPAFLYCHPKLLQSLENPIAGWFSHHRPFDFDQEYLPHPDIKKFLTGTPPILSLAAVEAGIDLVLEAGTERLRARSIALSDLLQERYESELRPLGYEFRSPPQSQQRGSHISLGHPEAHRITENLIQRHGVIPDFRRPDNIRLGIAPLYTTALEIDKAVSALVTTVRDREFASVTLPDAPVT